jgi:hypothetical protein
VTSDVGIAAFICDIREQSDDPQLGLRRFRGAGCHPSRAIALVRALTEAAQTRLTYIVGSRDDLLLEDYAPPDNVDVGEALLDALVYGGEAGSFHAVPSFDSDDIAKDVRWELEKLRTAGIMRVVAIDLIEPALSIPVVRIVIPSLDGDTRGQDYSPGQRVGRVGSAPKRAARMHRKASAPIPMGEIARTSGFEGRAVIFAGPSLPPSARPDDPRLVWRPPAKQGDLYRTSAQGPSIIGLIDGQFDGVPSVWHKEILWAMANGVHVCGAASIGALRAAELADFGMLGVGIIFSMYRDGRLVDDDEVAVLHAPEKLDYMPLTEAAVNVRATVGRAVWDGTMEPAEALALITAAKAVHYRYRCRALSLTAKAGQGSSGLRVDQKRLDALEMVSMVRRRLDGQGRFTIRCSHT